MVGLAALNTELCRQGTGLSALFLGCSQLNAVGLRKAIYVVDALVMHLGGTLVGEPTLPDQLEGALPGAEMDPLPKRRRLC